MADLTPELLARLEQDIASLTRHGEVRTSWAGNEVKATSGNLHVCDAPHKTACKIARLINAAPALVAAAKERDQLRRTFEMLQPGMADMQRMLEEAEHLCKMQSAALCQVVAERDQQRAEVEKQAGTSLGGMRREVAQLRDMLASAKAEIAELRRPLATRHPENAGLRVELASVTIERDRAKQELADIRGALDAHGHDGTFEAAAKLRDEAVKLRAEVEQIAGTSLGAMRRETAQLRDMLASAKAEIAELRHPLARRPPEDAGLRVECAQLRLDVERLRAIGLEAVKVLDRCGIETNFRALIGESPVRDFDPLGPADQLPADVLADVETERGMLQIERKP